MVVEGLYEVQACRREKLREWLRRSQYLRGFFRYTGLDEASAGTKSKKRAKYS